MRPLHGLAFLLRVDVMLDFIGMLAIGWSRHGVDHVVGQRVYNIGAQFTLLSFVFSHQSRSDRFVHVFSSNLPKFVHNPEEDFLGTASPGQLIARVADVSTGYISSAVVGEGDAVGKFAVPA